MRAGDLDRRIRIQSRTLPNTFGDNLETFEDEVTVWASKMDVTGRERIRGVVEVAEGTTVFRIRWRSGMTPEKRIIYNGMVYDIRHIAESGRREGLDITAVANGDTE